MSKSSVTDEEWIMILTDVNKRDNAGIEGVEQILFSDIAFVSCTTNIIKILSDINR